METYIKSRKINSNNKRIWGSFELSDRTTSKFEMRKGDAWYQWGNSTENLCITTEEVDKICNKWAENNF